MTQPRKLNINLSSLWENPTQKFTLRFKDINEKSKQTLAKKIKEKARQYRMRDPLHGPTIEEIYEALNEFNPIIFAESQSRNFSGYKGFNIYNACYIAGYGFHNLCQATYYLTCRKRQLNRKEVEKIVYLTTYNWIITTEFIDHNFYHQDPEQQDNRIDEISMERIEEARIHAENTGANNIPATMRSN